PRVLPRQAQRRRRVIARATIVSIAACVLIAQSAAPPVQADWTSERRRVPKIDSAFGGDNAERGAGLVVGLQGSDLYIATADHVVESASGLAQTIQVSFVGQSAQVFSGAALVEHDQKLDLAVLRLSSKDLAATFADAGRLCY